jgi:hypothetical protein
MLFILFRITESQQVQSRYFEFSFEEINRIENLLVTGQHPFSTERAFFFFSFFSFFHSINMLLLQILKICNITAGSVPVVDVPIPLIKGHVHRYEV